MSDDEKEGKGTEAAAEAQKREKRNYRKDKRTSSLSTLLYHYCLYLILYKVGVSQTRASVLALLALSPRLILHFYLF